MSGVFERLRELWWRIWFQDRNTVPLEVVRAGLGFLLTFNYGLLPPSDVLLFYGPHGMLSPEVVPEAARPLTFSLLYFLEHDWQVLLFHYVFVGLSVCLCLGWQTQHYPLIPLALFKSLKQPARQVILMPARLNQNNWRVFL